MMEKSLTVTTDFTRLDWDSNFFKFNVCRINIDIEGVKDAVAVNSFFEKENIKLGYYSSTKKLDSSLLKDYNVKLVDNKTTFIKKINKNLKPHPLIISYNNDFPSEKIVDIALQTGVYSRFNVDEKIGKQKYEEMYKIWIERSVNKEIANEVIIYRENNEVAGYLTVGEDGDRANLGIGAVDSNYRRKGIAMMLFESAEIWSGKNGYEIIQAITQGSNIAACNMYEKLGYHVETKKFFYHIWND